MMDESDLINSLMELHSTSKTKKDKKKDKKKSKKSTQDDIEIEIIDGGNFLSDINDDDNSELYKEEHELDLIDVDKLLNPDSDDDIIGDNSRGYTKLKKDANPYKKEFAEEITLLYKLLEETDGFSKDIAKLYKELTGSRTRGMNKSTTDLASTVLSAKQAKLQIIKEIGSLKKSIADLNIKQNKDKDDDTKNNSQKIAANYLKNIMGGVGRSNFIEHLNGGTVEQSTTTDSVTEEFLQRHNDYSEYEIDSINANLESEMGEATYRSSDADLYVKYENEGVSVYVKKDIETGDWEFIALNRFQQELNDYPLPDKSQVKKMKFNSDNTYATDDIGRSYKVIESY